MGERIYFLPENPVSDRKSRFVGHPLAGGLPSKLKALSASVEAPWMSYLQ
jgi:hypothetical protein